MAGSSWIQSKIFSVSPATGAYILLLLYYEAGIPVVTALVGWLELLNWIIKISQKCTEMRTFIDAALTWKDWPRHCVKEVLCEAVKLFHYCMGEFTNFPHWNNPLKENLLSIQGIGECVIHSQQQAEDRLVLCKRWKRSGHNSWPYKLHWL